ncbi:MAG: hypothetical protein GXO57_08665 [Thermodesulfobacteria bacterium]|nr:hypothetical protein [Thermodesulfobacteriota bacterium]
MKKAVKWLAFVVFFLFFTCIGGNAKKVYKKWVGYPYFYTTYINYRNSSIKNYGIAVTAYLSLWHGYFDDFQFGAGYTYIKYKNQPNLKQKDFTFAYSNTNTILKNHVITCGFHYISTTDDLTDNGKVGFLDITHYWLDKYRLFKANLGLGLYYSFYNHSTNFQVFQLLPHTSIKVFSTLKEGTLYVDLAGYYIRVSKSKELQLSKKNYFSFGADARYYYGRTYFGIGGWIGDQIFAVKSGGFVVYNLTEEYRGGAYFETGYTFKNGLYSSLKFEVTSYKEAGEKPYQNVVTWCIGGKF